MTIVNSKFDLRVIHPKLSLFVKFYKGPRKIFSFAKSSMIEAFLTCLIYLPKFWMVIDK